MLETEIRENLFKIVNAYAKATTNSLATISKKFYGNQEFLGEFKSGKASLSLRKLDLFIASISAAWPDGAEWPALMPVSMTRPVDMPKKSTKGKKIS